MNTKNFIVGDWVKAKSFEGEIVIGYIESVNDASKSVKIKAVQAEQDGVAGSSIETKIHSVSALPESLRKTKADIIDLIDLALLTHDKEWFEQLSADLHGFESGAVSEEDIGKQLSAHSRLNFPHVN
ncbi:IDEAL domain-containing protein [Rossellomorea vietnamensis]|uniref:IDEAL domain-containing protein n=1 Tax=Rossellomorea vietnamensis TaxID=218284 RepID=A0A5D4MD33_9BACI|nr:MULTISPECIES: IDEAL domain-containing protein [Bacillaceae]TYR99243.1 IDEAL domain-containing protein [Rossellomorea vietnamensis]